MFNMTNGGLVCETILHNCLDASRRDAFVSSAKHSCLVQLSYYLWAWVRDLMPSFQSPLPSDVSRHPKRKLHESEQSETTNSKRHASGAAFPCGDTQYWMVQWYVSIRVLVAIIEWAIIKESSSGKEAQDMGGGWGPRCD
jgi:hypothetical protein